MTFNTSLKDEISKNVYSSVDACSELSAFVRCNSKITPKQIIITLENASVARKIYKDIKTVFNISANITVRNQNRFRVKQIYILTINENIDYIKKVLNVNEKINLESDEEKIALSERMKGEKNPNYGHRWSKEVREKVSKHWKNYYLTHKSYIKGKTFEEVFGEEKSKELRQKISENASKRIGEKNPFYGRHHSEKTKDTIRQKRLGKKNVACSKKILVDNVIYESVDDCATKLGIKFSTVAYRCRKHIYGFSYIGENDNLPQIEAKKMWTFEECEKLASECKTIKEFREKYPNAYHHTRNKKEEFEKIKNKYFTYMRTYWTLEKVIELAKKYNSYKEFRENESTAYSSVTRHNWVDKVKEIYNK